MKRIKVEKGLKANQSATKSFQMNCHLPTKKYYLYFINIRLGIPISKT
jgi:hypothetical protein